MRKQSMEYSQKIMKDSEVGDHGFMVFRLQF